MTDRDLINAAVAAAKNSYSPYSGMKTGAAVECSDGTVYTGANVENAVLGSTVCAEVSAVCAAVSAGKRHFKRIAVWTDRPGYFTPCGNCRQMLQEFSPAVEVLCANGEGRYVSYPLKTLLPMPFNKDV